jgi:hypothetical protein
VRAQPAGARLAALQINALECPAETGLLRPREPEQGHGAPSRERVDDRSRAGHERGADDDEGEGARLGSGSQWSVAEPSSMMPMIALTAIEAKNVPQVRAEQNSATTSRPAIPHAAGVWPRHGPEEWGCVDQGHRASPFVGGIHRPLGDLIGLGPDVGRSRALVLA